jgi:hypothetical protein
MARFGFRRSSLEKTNLAFASKRSIINREEYAAAQAVEELEAQDEDPDACLLRHASPLRIEHLLHEQASV